MAILDGSADQDLVQLWTFISELSEQLSENRRLSVGLYEQSNSIKSQAIHSRGGFVLRRFNLDKSEEVYESELESMNATIAAENQSLQHDNKQLNTLIKEYEQTLENLMSNFRNRAREVQDRELSLIREYETKLLAREEANASERLSHDSAISQSLARISQLLRQFLRSQGGEDAEPPPEFFDDEDREPWTSTAAADHALERECELARLEKENEELRRMMGLVPSQIRRSTGDAYKTFEGPLRVGIANHQQKILGGASGSVGPFGTYKKAYSRMIN